MADFLPTPPEDDLFYAYAQNPAETECQSTPKNENSKNKNNRMKIRSRKSSVKCGSWKKSSSFVHCRYAGKATKLIKICIVDLVSDKTDSESENVLVKAQYLASDSYDDIVEQSEKLVNNISKKICGYSTCIY